MWKFSKYYALEIYTVITMLMITLVAMFMDDLSVVQQFVVWMTFLYILHEWEEGVYPGGFLDLISQLAQIPATEEIRRMSRIPTSVFLWVFSVVPFVWHDCTLVVMTMATFCIFEGFVHTMGIKLFRLKKFYTPGMVTAHIELVSGIALIVYLAVNHLGAWYDYVFGPLLFFPCFMCLQKTLTMMVGIRYRDLPKMIKAVLQSRK